MHCGDDCIRPGPSTVSAALHHIFLSLPVTKKICYCNHCSQRKCKVHSVYYSHIMKAILVEELLCRLERQCSHTKLLS
jgi:hypothetical protein